MEQSNIVTSAGFGFNYFCEKIRCLGYHDADGREYGPLYPRHNGDGLITIYGEKLDEWEQHNIMPNVALQYIVTSAFDGATQSTSWFLGIFTAAYDIVAGDTFATFLTAATESTVYTSATRVAYVKDAIVNGVMNNSVTKAEFTFNASATIAGAFFSSQPAKSSSTGIIASAARFSVPKTMASTDILRITAPLTPTSV